MIICIWDGALEPNLLKERMKRILGLLFLIGLALAFTTSSAQNSLSFSGTVYALPGSVLENTVVVACLLVNNECSDDRSGVQQINTGDSSAGFQITNLENADYLLLAWRDLNGNAEADAGDEIGVYQSNGRAALLRPPARNLELRLIQFTGDLDALIGQAEQPQMSPTPAPSVSPPPSATFKNTNITNAALRFVVPRDWRNLGNGIYQVQFGKDDPNTPKGTFDMTVMAPRAKSGNLLTQTRAIWQQETRGTLDVQGQQGGLFARRLPGGLNVGINFGSVGAFENPGGGTFESKIGTYAVMFLVETGAQVTPIFFKLSRIGSTGYTGVHEGMPLIETFMANVKPAAAVKVADLYTQANLIGKWKVSSGTYNNTNYYNSNTGVYVGNSFTQSAFEMRLNFRRDGTGDYFASLFMNTNGSMTRNTEDEPMRWSIKGDRITLERPRSRRSSTHVLYGISKDDKGQPVILAQLMTGGFTGQLLSEPDDLWLVDK